MTTPRTTPTTSDGLSTITQSLSVLPAPRTFQTPHGRAHSLAVHLEDALNAALSGRTHVRLDAHTARSHKPWGRHPLLLEGTVGADQSPFRFEFRDNHAVLTIHAPDGSVLMRAADAHVYPFHEDACQFHSHRDLVVVFVRLLARVS